MRKRARITPTPADSVASTPPASPPTPLQQERLNAYYCDTCQRYIVTIDRHEGTTPMFLACRADGDPTAPGYTGCKGQSSSMGYPRLDTWPEWLDKTPTWEWYTPDTAEVATYDAGMRDHVERGGLALRQVSA